MYIPIPSSILSNTVIHMTVLYILSWKSFRMFCISANGICTGICLIKVSLPQRCQLQQKRLVRLQTAPEWIFPINSIGLGKCQSFEERLKTSLYIFRVWYRKIQNCASALAQTSTTLCCTAFPFRWYHPYACAAYLQSASVCLTGSSSGTELWISSSLRVWARSVHACYLRNGQERMHIEHCS